MDFTCEMSPEEFPYITEIKVNDCYAYKDFVIPIGKGDDGKPFRHLILTGKNGSGKTTILRVLDLWLEENLVNGVQLRSLSKLENLIESIKKENDVIAGKVLEDFVKMKKVFPFLSNKGYNLDSTIYAFFPTERIVKFEHVESVTKEENLTLLPPPKSRFQSILKQYLVNKIVFQAFDLIEDRKDAIKESKLFFQNLTTLFKNIFEDDKLELEFENKEFEFYLKLKDGRRVTFNQLSDGYSALLSIALNLLVRVDILRKKINDFRNIPCGIVLIDEPEAHLHLELQYQVMPLLTTLFPNIQFIVATHSPAVISSIPNAIVYDLTKQQAVKDWVVGSSYSELMVKHFGLDNEYSNMADHILDTAQEIVDSNKGSADEKLKKLKGFLLENEKYLSPSLKLELESFMVKLELAA